MLYRAAIRRLAPRAANHSVPSLGLPRTSRVLGTAARVGAPSACQRLLIAARSPLNARFYATTRSKGTQTGKTKAKTAKAKSTRAKSKKKPAAKKKAAPKSKPKPKKKPALTEAEKITRQVRLLKQQALLDEPKYKPTSVWLLLSADNAAAGIGKDAIKQRKSRYESLSASERQTLQTSADANKRSNEILKRQYIERFTPYEIYRANLARKMLTRLVKKPLPAGRKRAFSAKKVFSTLQDPRVPKAPANGFLQYSMEQYKNGGQAVSSISDSTKTAATQWKSLSAAERKQYEDVYAFQREEYLTKLRQLMPERYAKAPRRLRSAS